MPAKYWVAKYVEDPIRNEPRNIGVIVSAPDGLAARFAGERDDGSVDRRRLQSFKYANVYKQWLEYWRTELSAGNIKGIVKAATPNYYVIPGGQVSDIGSDNAKTVCLFLYSLLVSDDPIMEAFELAVESDSERDLSLDVDTTFREWDILADQPNLSVRHPIKRKQHISGVSGTHEPSYSQENGKLYLFEAIDFNAHKPKLLKERAGFMAFMFSDIRELAGKNRVESFSIVRPKPGDGGEAIEYANRMLFSQSKIIDWSNRYEQNQFLSQRRKIAESL